MTIEIGKPHKQQQSDTNTSITFRLCQIRLSLPESNKRPRVIAELQI